MKRRLAFLCLVCTLLLAGCGAPEAAAPPAASGAPPSAAQAAPPAPAAEESPAAEPEADDVDIDLTRLSSTMVYSEVYNMMYDPLPYDGMTVRMRGAFSVELGYSIDGLVDPSHNYFYCVIADALACCSQGLEFDLAGDYAYPADYPEEGAEITVTGVFELYEEDGFRYLHLGSAVMEF